MSDIPIIGDIGDNGAPEPEDIPGDVKVFYKACKVVMNENGDCFAVQHDAPIATFTDPNSNDVVNMLRTTLDSLLAQQQAGVMMRTQMAVAAQMQKQAEDKRILDALNLKKPM